MRVIAASAALLLLLLANLAAPALSMASESEPKAVRQAPLAPFPASFAGLLPCADCPGIRYRIDFLKSGSYVQRATYL
ncbi:MAG: copper resistance protein NlpE N-terminal domain-containing protein, partial [Candidatus Eiseniibacteriota bacterium]